ncbi:ExbD/TolR family protein [Marinobacter gelidimuriae]|uniref:ExbD/TolR family protein n=1 Tax=Marinobacter gelidimuriae TaxID=2739064 RepID=UPI001E2E6A59|nr:biopolymer transporter ExbD [Marinobacter gelidimuriae]
MRFLGNAQSTTLTVPIAGSEKTLMSRVEDNLLPLINLVFLLLMFFIAVGQMSSTSLPDLPDSRAQQAPKQPRADLVVKSSGDWFVDGQSITEAQLLDFLPVPNNETPLRIGANRSMTMAAMEKLFQRLESGGYKDIVLLVQPGS